MALPGKFFFLELWEIIINSLVITLEGPFYKWQWQPSKRLCTVVHRFNWHRSSRKFRFGENFEKTVATNFGSYFPLIWYSTVLGQCDLLPVIKNAYQFLGLCRFAPGELRQQTRNSFLHWWDDINGVSLLTVDFHWFGKYGLIVEVGFLKFRPCHSSGFASILEVRSLNIKR